jgi:hypothetical protein
MRTDKITAEYIMKAENTVLSKPPIPSYKRGSSNMLSRTFMRRELANFEDLQSSLPCFHENNG